MTPEKQAELIQKACRENNLDQHIKWICSNRDATTAAERFANRHRFQGERLPVKNSCMYCENMDICFFFDRCGNACFSYAGHTITGAPNLVKHHLQRAFSIAEKVVSRMQELAHENADKLKWSSDSHEDE